MKRVYQNVTIEVEVSATLEGIGQWEDYGVPGSPRWWTVDPSKIEGKVDILGVQVELPKEVMDMIFELMAEEADEYKWEEME